jgi:LAO/AO transport system kinase
LLSGVSLLAVPVGFRPSPRQYSIVTVIVTQLSSALPAHRIPVQDYVDGIAAGDRALLARAITLVESTNLEHGHIAQQVLQALLPRTGRSIRFGITGVPGVGKSTTIDHLGMNLINSGRSVAVLAIDPTSKRTGGSILGDKTRMNSLALEKNAFIRPSPSSGTLGGVTRKTRETMALVEAAGFDVVIVETVGVGQSEVAVADMVDFFLVLLLAGGGDDLQGIKKGIIELADMIAINKADGDNIKRAESAAGEYRGALQIFTPHGSVWFPPVVTISGRDNRGLDGLWAHVTSHREKMIATGDFQRRRSSQAVSWMRDMIEDRMMGLLRANPAVAAALPKIEADVASGKLLPTIAVDTLMSLINLQPPRP